MHRPLSIQAFNLNPYAIHPVRGPSSAPVLRPPAPAPRAPNGDPRAPHPATNSMPARSQAASSDHPRAPIQCRRAEPRAVPRIQSRQSAQSCGPQLRPTCPIPHATPLPIAHSVLRAPNYKRRALNSDPRATYSAARSNEIRPRHAGPNLNPRATHPATGSSEIRPRRPPSRGPPTQIYVPPIQSGAFPFSKRESHILSFWRNFIIIKRFSISNFFNIIHDLSFKFQGAGSQ